MSKASPASLTTWNGSITATALGNSSVVALMNPVNPSIATTSTLSRNAFGDVLVTTPCMAPHVLVHPEHPDAVEPVRVVDQDALALGQDRVVRGVPRDPEPLSHSGHRQVLTHDRRSPHQG